MKTRGFLGRLVAVFAGAVMLLTNVTAVNADNADKRDRITESAEKVCQWQRDKMGISQDESIFSGNFLQNAGTFVRSITAPANTATNLPRKPLVFNNILLPCFVIAIL